MEKENSRQIIITVGREHGSGGHFIAQEIANNLGIKLYDKDIVEGTVELSGYSREFIEKMDEKPVNVLFSRRIGEFSNSLEENVAHKVFEYIHTIAEKGESFVIVGRCAESVLRHYPHVISVFISGDKEDKIDRIKRLYELDTQKAADRIKKVDFKRKHYHNYYSDFKWGDSRGYDILINSSRIGIENTAKCLTSYIHSYMEVKGIHLNGEA
ncbi:MAG: cytidylate kinase-like family protein [Eubacteriales bacterium]|nr:cytidylate kinase-like family protein [Eubacteriales bacterium]